MKESSVIVLPKEMSRREVLEEKLEEYKGRLNDLRKRNFYTPPESFKKLVNQSSSVRYKIALIERLFETGEINTYDFSLELNEKDDFFNRVMYDKAAGVIDDYCRTGGENVYRGTGFPKRKDEDIKIKIN